MNIHYPDDSLMLHTDLYQINMAKTYWQDGIHERKTVFDLYFRKLSVHKRIFFVLIFSRA